MQVFAAELRARQPDPAGRRWLYVPYDQLTDAVGPLSREDPATLGIVLIENPAKAARRPYHRQKLALVLANQRHFALEQAARGVAVRYRVGPYAAVLRAEAAELGPLRTMRPAERELRVETEALVNEGLLQPVPHEGWLTTLEDFVVGCGESPPWRMDAFYRRVRRRTGVLMEGGKPVGGRFSFDGENRKAWPGSPAAPDLPRFAVDPIAAEVGALIEERFADHPGALDLGALPVTAEHAEQWWAWARGACLPHFGPYEDAFSTTHRNLFHSRISQLMNLGRLQPQRVIDDVLAMDLPMNTVEGFVRQILGWREFVRHVHEATDGLRQVPEAPNLGTAPLPPVFWGDAPSGLRCLDHVIEDVWAEGYGHHITRLMVLGNLATLLDVDPRQLADWFWVAYTDAYDWVVEPNVLGMARFAVGELMTTKPYVSGAAYLNRMGDACATCAFHPKKDCPITALYWAFLARHEAVLTGNRRLAMPLRSLAKRAEDKRAADAATFEAVSRELQAGRRLTPERLRILKVA